MGTAQHGQRFRTLAGARRSADQAPNRRQRGRAGGRPPAFDPPPTNSATPSNGPSAGSASTTPWPPDTTNATTSGAAPSTSPPSGSGSATQSHDLQDRL